VWIRWIISLLTPGLILRELAKVPGAEPDRVGTGGDGPLHGLANPPGRVGRQLGLVGQVEAVDRFQEPAKPFLEKVGIGDPPVAEPLGDMGDQPHVGQGKLAPKLGIAAEDGAEPGLGRAIAGVERGDVVRQGLGIIGPPGHLVARDGGQGVGKLPLALAELAKKLALLDRAEHLGIGAVEI
jgi:hypothetical protein